MPAGLALHHHASPAACLKAERIYALPVLLSGLGALVLSKAEQKILYNCHTVTLSRLMKLHNKTPGCAVYFLAGSLPVSALLHLRQLSLFGMVSRLEQNLLKTLAIETLIEAKPSNKSWFQCVRDLCVMYSLPHPIHLLENPLPKDKFRHLCKQKVHQFWHQRLSHDVNMLPSLKYFVPQYLSLSHPHPLWSSLNGNPYETKAACIQALFLSGRYRSERLCRFWSQNKAGVCLLPACKNSNISEDIEHILLQCISLNAERRWLEMFTSKFAADKPPVQMIINTYLYSVHDNIRVQFLLDCSVLPLVITAHQKYGHEIHQHLFKVSRTWCRSLHLARMKALGRFCKMWKICILSYDIFHSLTNLKGALQQVSLKGTFHSI